MLKHQRHSNTSKKAARDFERLAKTKRYQVFRYISDNSGVTDKQVQEALNMNPSTQRPRRIELEFAELIRKYGESPPPWSMNLYIATGVAYPTNPTPGLWGKVGMPRANNATDKRLALVERLLERALVQLEDGDLVDLMFAKQIRCELESDKR